MRKRIMVILEPAYFYNKKIMEFSYPSGALILDARGFEGMLVKPPPSLLIEYLINIQVGEIHIHRKPFGSPIFIITRKTDAI